MPKLDDAEVVDVFGMAAALAEDGERFEKSLLTEDEESGSAAGSNEDVSQEELASAAEDALRNIDDAGRPADVSEKEFEEIRENLIWVMTRARGV